MGLGKRAGAAQMGAIGGSGLQVQASIIEQFAARRLPRSPRYSPYNRILNVLASEESPAFPPV